MGLDDVRAFYFRQQTPIPIYASVPRWPISAASSSTSSIRVIRTEDWAKLDPCLIEGPFDLWGEAFTPVPVMHGTLPILGFRFRKVVYIADCSTIPDESLPLLQDLDVLVLEALRHTPHPAHSTLEQSLAWVERLQPRRAFFTHMTHELGHEQTNALLPPHVRTCL